jgi:hypothetical protein
MRQSARVSLKKTGAACLRRCGAGAGAGGVGDHRDDDHLPLAYCPSDRAQALREWLEQCEEDDDLAAIAESDGDSVFESDDVKAEMQRTRAAERAG